MSVDINANNYRIDNLATLESGTLISLAPKEGSSAELPSAVVIFDSDNNGLDEGDTVFTRWDLKKQKTDLFDNNTGGLKENITSVDEKSVVSQVYHQGDSGVYSDNSVVFTKNQITQNEISNWSSWLNPQIQIAHNQRQELINNKDRLRIWVGNCRYVDFTGQTRTHREKQVKFSVPPLWLDSSYYRIESPYLFQGIDHNEIYSSVIPTSACLTATGTITTVIDGQEISLKLILGRNDKSVIDDLWLRGALGMNRNALWSSLSAQYRLSAEDSAEIKMDHFFGKVLSSQ